MYTELLTNKLNKSKKVMATKTTSKSTAKSKITKRTASNTKRPLPFASKVVTKRLLPSTSETSKAIMRPLPSLPSTGETSKAVKRPLPTTSKVQVSKKKMKIPEISEQRDAGNCILLFIIWITYV